ncbi:hypothetical protein M758_1G271900 [Ceratodon purpureus]|nr:hypothetical protein M758_1G271900 [Ceratodon purpureus]
MKTQSTTNDFTNTSKVNKLACTQKIYIYDTLFYYQITHARARQVKSFTQMTQICESLNVILENRTCWLRYLRFGVSKCLMTISSIRSHINFSALPHSPYFAYDDTNIAPGR